MVEDSITKKVYAGPPKIRQRGEFLSEVYYAPAGISRDATVSRIISRAKNGAQRRGKRTEGNTSAQAKRVAPRQCAETVQRCGREQVVRGKRKRGKNKQHQPLTTPAAPRHRSPVRRGGATARSGVSLGAITTRGKETPARHRPPRRAIARQCAGAAQRLAQACRWRDNNGREQNTSTPHTAAPRHRSPVRRGGATARSGVSLAR